jgi:hypothetical protein
MYIAHAGESHGSIFSICYKYAVEKSIRVPQFITAANIQTIIASANSSISLTRMSSSIFRRISAIAFSWIPSDHNI